MYNLYQLTYILPNDCLNDLMCVSSNCKTLSEAFFLKVNNLRFWNNLFFPGIWPQLYYIISLQIFSVCFLAVHINLLLSNTHLNDLNYVRKFKLQNFISTLAFFPEGEQLEMIDVRPLPTAQTSSGTANGIPSR